MGKLHIRAAFLILAALSAAHPARLVAQALARAMYVSVVDQSGTPVSDLGASDFVVREDKVAREILRVAKATDPMQIALLVDNSEAAERYVRDYREALTAFVTEVTADPAIKNQVAIITVGERPTINTDYTSNREQVIKGAQRIFSLAGTGSYLLEGIIETADGIVKRAGTRPVIVAVATEGPELSDRVYSHVLERLGASGAAFHVLVIGKPIVAPLDLAVTFDRGTKIGGGRYDNVLASSALTMKMKQLAAELTHEYLVTYAHPDSLIPPEQVTVSTPRQGLTARGTQAKPNGGQERR
jgi:hypothetical protein